jgi:hypothetical protein
MPTFTRVFVTLPSFRTAVCPEVFKFTILLEYIHYCVSTLAINRFITLSLLRNPAPSAIQHYRPAKISMRAAYHLMITLTHYYIGTLLSFITTMCPCKPSQMSAKPKPKCTSPSMGTPHPLNPTTQIHILP